MLTSKSFDPSKASIKRDAGKVENYFKNNLGKHNLVDVVGTDPGKGVLGTDPDKGVRWNGPCQVKYVFAALRLLCIYHRKNHGC
jgi:hypothetical protein